MKKIVKTSEILAAYNTVNAAKYAKMEDDGKLKVFKITRQLKPAATRFDEDCKEAAEKMKPTDDFTERLGKAQEYERLHQEAKPTGAAMSDADYEAFIKEFRDYSDLVAKAVREYGDKEVELDFEPLTDKEFGRLMASNDWTVAQAVALADVICQ